VPETQSSPTAQSVEAMHSTQAPVAMLQAFFPSVRLAQSAALTQDCPAPPAPPVEQLEHAPPAPPGPPSTAAVEKWFPQPTRIGAARARRASARRSAGFRPWGRFSAESVIGVLS
jgi:hypothetical protein